MTSLRRHRRDSRKSRMTYLCCLQKKTKYSKNLRPCCRKIELSFQILRVKKKMKNQMMTCNRNILSVVCIVIHVQCIAYEMLAVVRVTYRCYCSYDYRIAWLHFSFSFRQVEGTACKTCSHAVITYVENNYIHTQNKCSQCLRT